MNLNSFGLVAGKKKHKSKAKFSSSIKNPRWIDHNLKFSSSFVCYNLHWRWICLSHGLWCVIILRLRCSLNKMKLIGDFILLFQLGCLLEYLLQISPFFFVITWTFENVFWKYLIYNHNKKIIFTHQWRNTKFSNLKFRFSTFCHNDFALNIQMINHLFNKFCLEIFTFQSKPVWGWVIIFNFTFYQK